MSNDRFLSRARGDGFRQPTGGEVLSPAALAVEDRRARAVGGNEPLGSPEVTHLHQVIIIDNLRTPDRLPERISRNAEAARVNYPQACYRLWNGGELRDFLKENFDTDVLLAFETLRSYAYKCDLARLCLLYATGGMYIDLGVQILLPWDLPADCDFAAFRDVPFVALNWATMQSGLLWAKPRQPEMEYAIRFIVENCRNRYYGATPLHPTGPVLLGKAVIAAMVERGLTHARTDIGTCQRLTPESNMQNVTYVSRRGRAVALRTKLRAGDLSHLGIAGGNDYNRIWRTRRAYVERHCWLSAIERRFFKHRSSRPSVEPPGQSRSIGPPIDGAILHQITLDADLTERDRDRAGLEPAAKVFGRLHAGTVHKLWTLDEIRDLIRTDFDRDLLIKFDGFSSPTFRLNVALFCVMHAFGGFYLDHSLRMINSWQIPARCAIAGFSRALLPLANWTDIHTGLLWSRPNRSEWAEAIADLTTMARIRSDLCDIGAMALGRAFAASMNRRGQTASDDQWVGEVRSVTGPEGSQALGLVAPNLALVGLEASRSAERGSS